MKIKQAAKESGLSIKSVRYYEECHLLTVSRSSNAYREYTNEDVQKLSQIRVFRELGASIADIRLWSDGVISAKELIGKQKNALDQKDQTAAIKRALCDALWQGLTPKNEGVFTENEEPAPQVEGDFILGVDIGTTTISAALLPLAAEGDAISYTVEHHAAMEIPAFPDAYAQNGEALIGRALALIRSLCDTYPSIRAIGLTGQMHGIMCLDQQGNILSPLYTWQNEFGHRMRGDQTICQHIKQACAQALPTGYGTVTLFALKELGLFPQQTSKIATVMDVLAAKLCDLPFAPMHPTNAAGLGLFDITSHAFKQKEFLALGLDPALLPPVLDGFSLVGQHRGIPVSLAIGDNQASLLASLCTTDQILVNIGTGSQTSIITKKLFDAAPGLEWRPYFDGQYLLSGSALCGGRAYALLAQFVSDILSTFDHSHTKKEIYDRLGELAGEVLSPSPQVDTRFSGTRSQPDIRGSMKGIGIDNFSLGHLACGFMQGMAEELYRFYRDMGDEKREVVLSGNALRKNPQLRLAVAKAFDLPCRMLSYTEEAAHGAALYAAVSAGCLDRQQLKHFIIYQEDM